MMKKNKEISWLKSPKAETYPAAQSFLSLLYNDETAATHVKKLKRAGITQFKAKDIFRASGLEKPGLETPDVQRARKRLKKGEPVSPVLLVRDPEKGKVIIAEGYQSICAAYSLDHESVVACKII